MGSIKLGNGYILLIGAILCKGLNSNLVLSVPGALPKNYLGSIKLNNLNFVLSVHGASNNCVSVFLGSIKLDNCYIDSDDRSSLGPSPPFGVNKA